MNEAVDAAATVGTGAILAYEAERAHAPGHDQAETCANCGTRLAGPYCSICGQHGHVHRTAGAFAHDVLHGVFHFEGKFWTTLPLLVRRPGELTRRYAGGERAKFVSPMAMFLFSVFLLFAVVANLPGWQLGENTYSPTLSEGLDQTRIKLAEARLKADERIGRELRRLARLRTETADADTVSEIARSERKLADLRVEQSRIVGAQRYLPSPDKPKASDEHASNWFSAKLEHARQNPELLIYKIKNSAYKYSWALIPISLPFIWLLFPFRRDVGFYDHAVFATYSLSFMSLLGVMTALLAAVGLLETVMSIVWLVPPVHMYLQIRGAYRLGRGAALWRTFWMLIFASITSAVFVTLLVYLGTAG